MRTQCETYESRSPGASDLLGLLHPLGSRGSGWNCWLRSVSEMRCLSRRSHTRVCGPAKPERCVGRMYGQVRSWSNEPSPDAPSRRPRTEDPRSRLIGALADDLAMWRMAPFSGDGDFVFANRTGPSPLTTTRNWRSEYSCRLRPPRLPTGRPIRPAALVRVALIHEGRSLAEVAVQLGDAVATVASTYTQRSSKPRHCPASRQRTRSRRLAAIGVRQLYVGLEARLTAKPAIPHQKREPTPGLEPRTPSLRVKCSTS